MRLTKWYGDYVDAAGPHVVYRAALALGPLTLGFEGGHDPAAGARASYSLTPVPLPRLQGGGIDWPFGEGALRWEGASARGFDLHAARPGAVRWEPLCLNGALTGPGVGAGQRGYAERLTLSLAPWSLGLRVLRWGRFCGARHALAWIEWEGDRPLRLALRDGVPTPLRALTPEAIVAEGAALRLGAQRPFVETRLAQGLLSEMPWPKRLRPLAFLDGIEVKSYGRGRLDLDDGRSEEGDVILEEVRWQ